MADTPLQAAYDEADITPPLGGSVKGFFRDRQARVIGIVAQASFFFPLARMVTFSTTFFKAVMAT
jgi:hypothetical protein